MKIYIISYLNNEIKREKPHIKQLEWLKENFKLNDIFILAQNYSIDKMDEINYIINNPIKPSLARNKLLSIFYSSNEEYGLFIDDDVILKYKNINISKYIEKLINKNNYWDSLTFNEIRYSGSFKDENKVSLLKKSNILSGAAFIWKNFKKLYDKEIYFDENLNEYGLEDNEIAIQLNYNNLKHYMINRPYIYELSSQSIFFNKNDRKIKYEKAREYISNKWINILGCNSLIYMKNKKLFTNKFFSQYNYKKNIILNLEENEI